MTTSLVPAPANALPDVMIVAARRTAVMPRHGAFAAVEPTTLAAAVIEALLEDTGVTPTDVDDVILGNALYGGGNPARVSALLAGLPDTCPAMSLDTQCCSGLDALLQGAAAITRGDADVVIAGGVESFSRSPLRAHRPKEANAAPLPYDRPPFTPWPERDPDMIAAAATLAETLGLPRNAQEAYAIDSHRKALAAPPPTTEMVPIEGQTRDGFTRHLTPRLCGRLPVLPGGDEAHGCTSATVAVEADAAAAVLLMSGRWAARLASAPGRPVRLLGGARRGDDPTRPPLAPIGATRAALERYGLTADRIAVAEVMEAFAMQAMACIDGIGLDPATVNRGGGALARGHPIGASGAVLAVRLWHEMQAEVPGALGLATIAAAGGLGSTLVVAA